MTRALDKYFLNIIAIEKWYHTEGKYNLYYKLKINVSRKDWAVMFKNLHSH